MTNLIPLILIGAIAIGWGDPIVTPSTATLYVGQSIQFTSTDTVTWSLRAGSMGSISGTGVYTAPAQGTMAAKQNIAGCQGLSNDHIYNTRVDALPVHADSPTRIANIGGGASTYIAFEVNMPLNITNLQTPTTALHFFYTPQHDASYPIVPAPYTAIESYLYPNTYFGNLDRHLLSVSTDTCNFYEMYNYYPMGANGSCPTCNSQSGVAYNGMSYDLATQDTGGATDAAGLYILPLSLKYDELKAGNIQHALRFTLSNGTIYSGFLWPGTASTNQCGTSSICTPYGSRFRLKSSFSETGFSRPAVAIIQAMKKYGMFMSDGGISMHVQVSNDVVSDTATWTVIESELLNQISQYQFEQVDESSLMVSSTSGKVNLDNAYVTPSNFAEVVCTKNSDSSSTTVRVAIQAVTAGFQNPAFPANTAGISVMSGTPGFQIPAWVNGSTNTALTFSMSPTVGSLTSGGIYTAPASQTNQLLITTVTVTPSDSTGTIKFPLTVFPSDGIRYNVGGKSGASSPPPAYDAAGNYGPDVDGKYWWSDPAGTMTQWYYLSDFYYPQSSWGVYVDTAPFFTGRSSNNDGAWSAMVPNGTYTLKLGFAADVDPSNRIMSVDSQGSTIISSTTLSGVIGSTAFSPRYITRDVTVSDNKFYFAMRMLDDAGFTQLNLWSLTQSTNTVESTPRTRVLKGGGTIRGSATFK